MHALLLVYCSSIVSFTVGLFLLFCVAPVRSSDLDKWWRRRAVFVLCFKDSGRERE